MHFISALSEHENRLFAQPANPLQHPLPSASDASGGRQGSLWTASGRRLAEKVVSFAFQKSCWRDDFWRLRRAESWLKSR